MTAKNKTYCKKLFDDLFKDAPNEYIEDFIEHLHLPHPLDYVILQSYIYPKKVTNEYFAKEVIHKGTRHFYNIHNNAIKIAYRRAIPYLYECSSLHIINTKSS